MCDVRNRREPYGTNSECIRAEHFLNLKQKISDRIYAEDQLHCIHIDIVDTDLQSHFRSRGH